MIAALSGHAAVTAVVSLPREISADIADLTAGTGRGFGSVRIAVMIGATSWQTSIFPDGKDRNLPASGEKGGPYG